MKNQNKILMSLLTASVSALAAAPALAQDLEGKDQGNVAKSENNNYIDFKNVLTTDQLTEAQLAERFAVKNDIKAQVAAMLNKKAPIMKISESIDIVVDNYGKNNETIKQRVFEELQLGAVGAYCYQTGGKNCTQDSTTVAGSISNKNATVTNPKPGAQCHAYCHSACHGACHGSRSWR